MKILTISLLLTFSFASIAQISVNSDKKCSHCGMLNKDPQFIAMAIEQSDKVHEFDAIECLVNFLKSKDESKFKSLLVANYAEKGKLINAQSAFYLKSKNIASPMGAYLSGYSSLEAAERIKKEQGGEIMNWEELKTRFKNSNFGLLSHPTHHHDRPDAYAPIGVMGDHLHHAGGFMVSIRYMNMAMQDNLMGSADATNMSIYQDFMVAPQTMDMGMYMIGVMYAPSDKLTLMVMQNFIRNTMDLRMMMGMEFTTESEGFGDLRISGLYGLITKENSSIQMNASINIPVGDIEQRDDTPMMENMKLAYPMQLGSGTVDYTIGATYKGSANLFSWGVQQINTFRSGENSQGYRFGNQNELNTWVSFKLTNWVSISQRFHGLNQNKIVGIDSDLNPMMAPLANINNSGFKRIRSYFGANFSFGENEILRDFKLGIEYGLPVYQHVEGIQMSEKNYLTAGLRYTL